MADLNLAPRVAKRLGFQATGLSDIFAELNSPEVANVLANETRDTRYVAESRETGTDGICVYELL